MSGEKAHYATTENTEAKYQVLYKNEVILESNEIVLLKEHYNGTDFPPVIYFPQAAIDTLETSGTEQSTNCPIKGDASYLSYKEAESGIWTYGDPNDDMKQLKGHYAFDQKKGFKVSKVVA